MANEKIRETLNRASPAHVDAFRAMQLGSVLAGLPRTIRMQVPNASGIIELPENLKASTILRAWARSTSAAGTCGGLTIIAFAGAPADGEIAVTANGNLAVNSVSAYTAVDITYMPLQGDVIEVTMPVVANVLTLPALAKPASSIMLSATSVVGGVTGAMVVDAPAAAAPAAGHAKLNLALTTVSFAAADAVTRATVRLLKARAVELGAYLETDSTIG